MNIGVAVFVAFMIILAFIVGGVSMFRISEHYNKELRDVIARRADDPYDSLFECRKEVHAQHKKAAQTRRESHKDAKIAKEQVVQKDEE